MSNEMLGWLQVAAQVATPVALMFVGFAVRRAGDELKKWAKDTPNKVDDIVVGAIVDTAESLSPTDKGGPRAPR